MANEKLVVAPASKEDIKMIEEKLESHDAWERERAGASVARSIKWTATMLAALGIIGAAATWAGDTRYITKSEFQAFAIAQELTVVRAAAALRKGLLEDKIFELDLVPDDQKTAVQRAMANRAKTQLQDVQTQLLKDARP